MDPAKYGPFDPIFSIIPGVAHLLYDGDCTFCKGFARRLEGWSGRIKAVPFSDRETVRRLAPGLDEERLLSSMHVVDDAGTVLSGPDAVPELARLTLPGGAAAAWLLRHTPGSRTVLKWTYKWISEHRW